MRIMMMNMLTPIKLAFLVVVVAFNKMMDNGRYCANNIPSSAQLLFRYMVCKFGVVPLRSKQMRKTDFC